MRRSLSAQHTAAEKAPQDEVFANRLVVGLCRDLQYPGHCLITLELLGHPLPASPDRPQWSTTSLSHSVAIVRRGLDG